MLAIVEAPRVFQRQASRGAALPPLIRMSLVAWAGGFLGPLLPTVLGSRDSGLDPQRRPQIGPD